MSNATQQSVFDDVLDWSQETFKNRSGSSVGIINHLLQEMNELMLSNFEDVEEMADVCFMLIQLADAHGSNLEDAIKEKLEKNKAREWPSEPDEYGIYNHKVEA